MAQPAQHKLEWSEDADTQYQWLTVFMAAREPSGRGIPAPSVALRGFVRRTDGGLYFACLCASTTPEADFVEVGEFRTINKAKEAVELAYMENQLKGERA